MSCPDDHTPDQPWSTAPLVFGDSYRPTAEAAVADLAALELLAGLLLGEAIYVCWESRGAPSPQPGCWGCTSPTCDLLLKPWLESADRWRGRQPAVFMADRTIRAAIATYCPADADQRFAEYLPALMIHELGHCAQQRIDLEPATETALKAAEGMALISTLIQESRDVPPWFGHDAQWIRLTLHLHHRANAFGYRVPEDLLFSGADYSLPEPDQWSHALIGEPEAMASEPIRDVLTFRPPFLFRELWIANVERWRANNPDAALSALGELCLQRSTKLFF